MDEDSQEEKPNASGYSRHRSPVFSREEVKTLISLIERFKNIITNKSTSAAASHAKDVTWVKITKLFNNNGFKHERSTENLKTKWDNLKKDAKKVSKNLLDVKHIEFDEVTSQIVTLMCEAENISNSMQIDETMDFNKDSNDIQKKTETYNLWEYDEDETKNNSDETKKEMEFHNLWEHEEDKTKNKSDGNDGDNSRSINRRIYFTPKESTLLLRCIRQEKKIIFWKSNTGRAIKLKNRAWNRITNAYNKLSPRKRSRKVLQTKFTNMKKFGGCINVKDNFKYFGKKHEHLKENIDNEIKSEQFFDYEVHSDPENDDEELRSDTYEKTNGQFNFIPDPLSTVMNSDSGIDLIDPLENKEAVKLKIQLLKCKLETAKLEKKRVEDAIQSETIENALRLRTARLKAVAAEMKLPPAHPARSFTVEELPAHQYLLDYSET